MDRSKWEYKKLGEICAPKSDILRANKLFGNDDIIDYVDISSIDNTTHCITQPTSYVFKEAPSRAQQKVEQGDVLYSLVRPNLKNIAVVTSSDTNKYVASSGFCVLRGKDVETRYLYHMVLGDAFTNYILGLVSGANYPAVREDDVKGFSFRCPPLAVQQRIVAELDCLNEMIALKQEQLKEFDKLAQSIFYDMFGDPITNEKGWNVVSWNDVLQILNGRNQKLVETPEGKYPICGSAGIMGWASDYICPEDTIIIGRKGNINKPILMREKFWNVDTAFGLVPNREKLDCVYLYYFCDEYDFEKHNRAVTIPSLTKSDLLKISFPLPPLALQQQFAEKIQAIEAQKELVKQSIAETQHLLDSRMDYYFD